jgi:threonyl-tRNA synthetase
VLTITDEQKKYAQTLAQKIRSCGYRVVVDESSDPLSGQIKSAQLQQIPWLLIVGNKEMSTETVTLRFLDGKQIFGLTFEQLLQKAAELQEV